MQYKLWDKNKKEWVRSASYAMYPDGNLYWIRYGAVTDKVDMSTHILVIATGVRDESGRMIFESDIVTAIRAQNEYTGPVVWYRGGWYIHTLVDTEIETPEGQIISHKGPGYIRLVPRFTNAVLWLEGNLYEKEAAANGK